MGGVVYTDARRWGCRCGSRCDQMFCETVRLRKGSGHDRCVDVPQTKEIGAVLDVV